MRIPKTTDYAQHNDALERRNRVAAQSGEHSTAVLNAALVEWREKMAAITKVQK